jgi:hypothetical protein
MLAVTLTLPPAKVWRFVAKVCVCNVLDCTNALGPTRQLASNCRDGGLLAWVVNVADCTSDGVSSAEAEMPTRRSGERRPR